MSATEIGSQRSPAHQRFKPGLPTDLLHCAVYGSHSPGRPYLSYRSDGPQVAQHNQHRCNPLSERP
ncbi:hypothetical protein K466DRAFT_607626 [Polyporus arcularius HHB13444]|uniref:Uncharacterized protein n=1 Tax=Polyporus arcularius HHB13444 TaxID=1314778 RepID=A0A5C3NKW0_9APHY|nr:hypothetical protein K466DRAFT_607626 [Polyporus arcularius HHB13444]